MSARPVARVATVLSWVCLVVCPAREAHATPQITSDVSLGGGAVFAPGGAHGVFTMALRADVLFGGVGPYVPRVGPFVSVRTDDYTSLAPSAGVSFLLPVAAGYPVVLSAGGAVEVTSASPGPRAAVLGRLWWGGRSYNYHAPYGLTVGLWAEARYFPDGGGTADLVGGLDADLEVFSLPFILLYNWLAR